MKRCSRGQAAAEMAIALPLLLLLASGVLDLGRAWQTQTAMNDAARNTARVVAGEYGTHGPDDNTVCAELENDLQRFGTVSCTFSDNPPPYSNPALSPGQVRAIIYPEYTTASCGPASPCRSYSGDPLHTRIYVFVYYDFQLLTPIISQLAGSNGILTTAQASMRSSW